MTYADLLARLLPARRFGMVFGLERMRALLDRLGAPDRHLGTIIHVAGTNGKGSTVAMIAALATAAGARVATYTSPHLTSLRERIAIGGAPIDEDAIVRAAEIVYTARGDELTFFEQITAIAAVAIADARVDVTILEVGLGGRLDATNAIDAPIAVITGVAMDHEAILGSTLEAIASEKAGILKPAQRVVIGASGEPAAVPLLVAAGHAASTLVVIDDAMIAKVPEVALPGAHQRRNAAAALAAFDALAATGLTTSLAPQGLTLEPADRARALAAVRHPGRFEIVPPGDVILDGAHNPQGARALAETLRAKGLEPVLILGVSTDKDVAAIVRALAPAIVRVIATRYQQERAMPTAALAAIVAGEGVPVEEAPELAVALEIARRDGRPIVIAGSLFLVGEARVLLCGAIADPIVLSDPPPPNRA